MKLSTPPLQSSRVSGDWINTSPTGRRWGSGPKANGYPTPLDAPQAPLPLTPIQREMLRQHPEPQWLTYPLALPSDSPPSVDRIQFAWEAVAAHVPMLTSTLVNLGSSVEETCIVAAKHVQPLRFSEVSSGVVPGPRSATIPPYVVFQIRDTGEPTATLHIPRLLVDDASLRLIRRDFSAVYRGEPFAERAPYSAYVQDVLTRDQDAARAFWSNVLKGSSQAAPLFHGARVAAATAPPPSKERHRLSVSSDSEVLDRLVQFERRTGFKQCTALQAAWALVLSQHQSTESVLFGTAARDSLPAKYGGRTAVGRMDVAFPLAVHVQPGTSVCSLLSDIEGACQDGTKQAFIGFKAILEQSPLPSLAVQSCLKFVEDAEDSSLCVDDDGFGLTLYISTTDQVRLTIQYDAAIPHAKIRVLVGHCLSALVHVLRADSEPAMDVRQVDLATPAERTLILEKALPKQPPREGTLVHSLFEEQVVRTPDRVAVQFETGDRMTYLELNRAANKVARRLPCGPGSIVPVYMHRSIELVVSLLAILKSGAGYVTLDPDFPMERSKIIIEDVGAPFVLTLASLASRFLSPTVVLEHVLHGDATGSEENLNIEQSSRHVAYVIYTSGSTGIPKGVVLEHGAAVTGLVCAPKVEGLRSLLFYNPVFSAAQRTIFSTFMQGGCLCLASKESLTVALAETINKMEVNTVGLTASTASLLTQERLPSLRVITVTGEKVNSAVAERWAGKLEFQAAYGLSECTQLTWRETVKPGRNPNEVGRPRDTTQAYVLIPGTTTLAPLLVPGELCLGGHQLARGYLNRPEQTARSFIDNPFHPGRLFRTGDMAVCLENGNIELLGRIDFKVKIAGQQVDPEGVASVVQDSGLVATACVVPVRLNEETCLVACVLLGATTAWNGEFSAKLRSHSQSILPGYSVPSFWIPLESLPLNANGKVDKMALRTQLEGMGREGLIRASRFKRSSGDEELSFTEMSLRKAWADVLNLEEGSIRSSDGFLSLGGSSLHAIMVVTRLHDHGLSVAPADIIQSSSLRRLAGTLVKFATEMEAAPERFSLLPASSTYVANDLADFEDAYPASALQEALVASSVAGSSDYLYQRVWNIKGVDIPKLHKAFEEVFASTDILRTTFVEDGVSFLQVVLKSDHPLRWEERYESLADFKALDLSEGIVLGKPFFRVAVLPAQSLLVVTAHHSLFDYWCNQFVFEDVAAVYSGRARTPRPQFKFFIRHMVNTRTVNAEAFWSRYLENATPSRLGAGIGTTKQAITKLVRVEFQPFLRSHSLTLASLVYAAWALVLSSRTSSNDVVFATTLSGRDAPIKGIESLDGPTFASVPHRVNVEPSLAVIDYVRGVQNGLWALSMQAQDGMRNALRLSGNDSALFDTLVNILVKPPSLGSGERSAVGGLFSPYGEQPAWSTEYTTLEAVVDDENSILFRLSSDFETEYARFILEQVVTAVEEMVAKPDCVISSLSTLGEAERDKLLSFSTRIEAGSCELLHARFERMAAATPHRIAIQWQDTEYVSYIELNDRANRLAAILRAKGVGPNVCVPLCLEKSVNMVVAIFAVLKAGGAYVPLDPGNPPQRNTFITGDVEAKVVLCGKEHAQIFATAGFETMVVDELDLSEYCPNHVVPNLTPDNLAYILYTSGSTGTPKGVMIKHSGVSTSINASIDFVKCRQEWRTLFFSNYVFDASVGDIFTVLGCGGTMCLAPTADLLGDLAHCINSMRVAQVFLTPTVAKLIDPANVPGITTIMLGGEPLTADLVAKWTPRCTVINMYGPTENSIYATMTTVTPGSNTRIIGKPMTTVSAAVLSTDGLEPVPIGAIGELCLSGPQLARGYLKRDDATASAFVEWRGERLYRTGDLVRWLPDGQLECFGRKDQQKKLHGHRIELGEIEQAILLTQQVSDCLVAIMETETKEELVAFCVYTNSSTDVVQLLPAQSYANEAEIISSKLTTLPPYMVPKVWIPVSSFPLMPSGKADRRKIIRLVQDSAVQLRDYSLGGSVQMVIPHTKEEKLLQRVWGELLQIDQVSISAMSSFFSMGGDSITAINLVSRCRREEFSISVADVLAFPVLRDMAKIIKPLDETGNSRARQEVLYEPSPGIYEQLAAGGVEPSDIENVTLAVPGQAEFLNRGQTEDQFWQLLAVRPLPMDLDFGQWVVLTRQLTERNAILRTMYLRDDRNAWVQVTLKAPVLDLETVQVPDEATKEQVIQDMWERPFDLSRPFVRYRLIILPDGSRFLVIKLDHAMYDGTLLRIFDSQFVAMARGETVEKAVPFHTFSTHIHSLDKSGALGFWTELLKDNTFSYPATTQQPRISGTTLRKVDHRVDAFAVRCGSTVSTVFQAAFSILLGRLSNMRNVSYDNLVTGRNVEIEDAQMINGTCANFIPFRSSLQPESTMQSFLKETQALFWKTTENGTVGLDDIYAALNVDREASRSKCLFVFQPFEPNPEAADHMRWIVMSLSKTKMPIDYALMLEVVKSLSGYTLRIKYDSRVYATDAAEAVGDMLVEIVEGMLYPQTRLEELLRV